MCFYKVFDQRKNLINFNYRTNLSEMKANVWEGRNESDWSIFPDWFTGEKLGQKFDDGHTGPKFDQNGLKSVK